MVNRQTRRLSPAATKLLRRIVALRSATVGELVGPEAAQRVGVYNSLHLLSDRWLITVDGGRVRPRQRGVDLLRTAAYRGHGEL